MITEPDFHKPKLSFFESKQGECKCYSKFGLYNKTSGDFRRVILVSFKNHFMNNAKLFKSKATLILSSQTFQLILSCTNDIF